MQRQGTGWIWVLALGAFLLAPNLTAAARSSSPTGDDRAARIVCPVAGKVAFTDTWGAPRSGGRRHKGVDMFTARGTRLEAVTRARVLRAGWSGSLGGLGVTLRDANGTEYYYAHLSRVSVHAGQRVARGQQVGRVGNTGNAIHTPPHLHFEVRPHGRTVNPTPYARRWC